MAFALTNEARKEANLRVLQKQDSAILDILGYASHVVLYEFVPSSSSWQKLNVEGSLFLVKRQAADVSSPRFRLFVLNRNSKDNYQIDVTPTFQVQDKDPYLMFRKDNGTIIGIWFHNGQERQQMMTLLQRVIQSFAVDPNEAAASAAASLLLSPLTLAAGDDGETTTTTTATKTMTNGQRQQRPPQQQPSPTLSLHRTPSSPQSPSPSASPSSVVLDKKSLQLALLSLLHDDRFLDLIHAQYLKVAHARANKAAKATSSSSTNDTSENDKQSPSPQRQQQQQDK